MKPDQLDQMLAKASRSVQLLNKHLARVCPAHADYVEPEEPKAKKRIRQDTKPLLNKLEEDFKENLLSRCSGGMLMAQKIRFRLGNGVWYKPDFVWFSLGIGPRLIAYEVKGPHAFRGGFENLKIAASTYPLIRWVLAWKENGLWVEQDILS